MTKCGIIKNFDKIWHNFRNFRQKSRFSKVLVKITIFQKIPTNAKVFKQFWRKSIFSDNFDHINIFENFYHNQEFYKFWLKSRFPKILTKIKIIYNNFWQNSIIWKVWPKSRLFDNKLRILDQNRAFSNILTRIEIFRIFFTKLLIFRKFYTKSRFFKIIDKIKVLPNFWTKSRFSKILGKIKIIHNNFWQNSIIWKFWPKSRLFEEKLRIPRILTEIEIFKNIDQNWNFSNFFFTKIHIFGKFYTQLRFFKDIEENQGSSKLLNEIKIFENFDQNWDYLKILTSIEIFFFFFFFTKFDITSENADKNRNFRKIWPPIWNLSETMTGIKIWIF